MPFFLCTVAAGPSAARTRTCGKQWAFEDMNPAGRPLSKLLEKEYTICPVLEFLKREGDVGLRLLSAIRKKIEVTKQKGFKPHPYLLQLQEQEEVASLPNPAHKISD